MAREIKFRAWNKNWKEMEHDIDDITPSDDYILMQYTGQKDKNGKEIYEGDVVSSNSTLFKKVEVYYCEHLAGFYPFSVPSEGGYEYDTLYSGDCEVIGNIHENPDLL